MTERRGRGRPAGFKMPEEHRSKISQSMILNRLSKLVKGEIDMPPHAVTAALGLLRKVLPDLSAQELTVDTVHPFALLPAQLDDPAQWQDTFKPKATEH